MKATPLNPRSKSTCVLRVVPKIKWEKDRGKEPKRAKTDFPWFWGWENASEDQKSGKEPFLGTGKEPDGNRWNDLHYSREFKQDARARNSADKKKEKR